VKSFCRFSLHYRESDLGGSGTGLDMINSTAAKQGRHKRSYDLGLSRTVRSLDDVKSSSLEGKPSEFEGTKIPYDKALKIHSRFRIQTCLMTAARDVLFYRSYDA
jgi:hypothetical protein